MAMIKSLAVTAAAVAVLNAASTQGSAIETNPTALVEDVVPLTHTHPAYGAGVADEITAYEVRAFKYDEPVVVVGANLTGTRSRALRNGESRELTSSRDITKLEEFFKTKMETNFKTLSTGVYRKAAFATAPWPSSYWAIYQDGINAQWDLNEKSPAEKYALGFGLDVKTFQDKVSNSNGILSQKTRRKCKQTTDCDSLGDGSFCGMRKGETAGFCIPGWFGICHAWAPAAILEDEPQCAVTRKNVTFQPMDIKALITQVYDGASIATVFTGARFNGPNDPAKLDEHGRYVDAARRDMGAGFFHIAITNIMGKFKKSFIVDVTAGAEVWNQPVRNYDVVEMKEMDVAEASQQFFQTAKYPFNPEAKRLAYVKTNFFWIVEALEDGPLVSTGRVDAHTQSAAYEYLLELDGNGNIIGGEWVGESRYNHPDFLWFPTGKPPANTVTNIGLKYSDVEKLLEDSIKCAPQATPMPTTPTPTTPMPTTPMPTTLAPNTTAPTTLAPNTTAPTTLAPNTTAPTTLAPNTTAPTTLAPNTTAPTTLAPNTTAPTTLAPNTTAPTTLAPNTTAPTTLAPNTTAPSTEAPTTAPNATMAPNTTVPSTEAPTTAPNATMAPNTTVPSTEAPTTAPNATSPATTAPVTTAPNATTPATTAPNATSPATTAPNATTPATTAPVTTAPDATTPAPATTAPVTTVPSTATPATTTPTTSAPATEAPTPVTVRPNPYVPPATPATTAPTTVSPTPKPSSDNSGDSDDSDDLPPATVVPQTPETPGQAVPTQAPATVAPTDKPVTVGPATSAPTESPATTTSAPTESPATTTSAPTESPATTTSAPTQSPPMTTPAPSLAPVVPGQCGKVHVGVDFFGADLQTVYYLSQTECCAECAATEGCKAFTFVATEAWGGSACYLKSGRGTPRPSGDAVSGELPSSSNSGSPVQDLIPSVPTPKPDPTKCAPQQHNIDFFGADLFAVETASAGECCAACADTEHCNAYTFVQNVCYLKRSTGQARFTLGVISGIVLTGRGEMVQA